LDQNYVSRARINPADVLGMFLELAMLGTEYLMVKVECGPVVKEPSLLHCLVGNALQPLHHISFLMYKKNISDLGFSTI